MHSALRLAPLSSVTLLASVGLKTAVYLKCFQERCVSWMSGWTCSLLQLSAIQVSPVSNQSSEWQQSGRQLTASCQLRSEILFCEGKQRIPFPSILCFKLVENWDAERCSWLYFCAILHMMHYFNFSKIPKNASSVTVVTEDCCTMCVCQATLL